VDWLTGNFDGSPARGRPFGVNPKTGDARISGALASLVGLEAALERQDPAAIDRAIEQILLLHGLILSFGGIPLLYYGDEIGTFNDCSFLEDATKAGDNRWIHRPRIDWERAERRRERGSIEQRVFDGLKRMIAVRKTIPAFADFNNRELLEPEDPRLFAFLRTHPALTSDAVLVVANLGLEPASLDLPRLCNRGYFQYGQVRDLYTGSIPELSAGQLIMPPSHFYWLTDQRPGGVL
jgi:amylosucrase